MEVSLASFKEIMATINGESEENQNKFHICLKIKEYSDILFILAKFKNSGFSIKFCGGCPPLL